MAFVNFNKCEFIEVFFQSAAVIDHSISLGKMFRMWNNIAVLMQNYFWTSTAISAPISIVFSSYFCNVNKLPDRISSRWIIWGWSQYFYERHFELRIIWHEVNIGANLNLLYPTETTSYGPGLKSTWLFSWTIDIPPYRLLFTNQTTSLACPTSPLGFQFPPPIQHR